MKSLLTLSLLAALATPVVPAFADDSHSDFYHSRVKATCDKRQNKRGWAKGNAAFARDVKGLHCGWRTKAGSERRAKQRAIAGCEKRAGVKCRIIFSKKI